MPFAALKGYEEALREKERIIVEKKELSEERKEELDIEFQKVQRGVMVEVEFFQKDAYIHLEGMVSQVDRSARYICVVNQKILIDDIYMLDVKNS